MKKLLIILFLIPAIIVNAQTVLTMEGQTYTNTETGTWMGVDVRKSVPTLLTFKNNSITSHNTQGYMLLAGDEGVESRNNKLDNAVISGNKFYWIGPVSSSIITHGLFTGHNSNVIIKYNNLLDVPMGIIRKSSNNMSNTGGGVAYNIVRNGLVAVNIKGMSNVNIYNNTLYTKLTEAQTWRGLIQIYTGSNASVSHGTKIFNNIFYTKYGTLSIYVEDTASLRGLQSDYNVFWCENGSPRFRIGSSTKSFAQWQALGYDTHSVVLNPNFKDLESFVPTTRLNYGINLDTMWRNGLSTTAVWGTTDPQTTAQNGAWQVGAIVYGFPTGVKESLNNSQNVSIYPNPARQFINVTFQEKSNEKQTIRIFDLLGNICLEKQLDASEKNQIPINLKSGLYIVQVKTGSSGSYIQKLNVIE